MCYSCYECPHNSANGPLLVFQQTSLLLLNELTCVRLNQVGSFRSYETSISAVLLLGASEEVFATKRSLLPNTSVTEREDRIIHENKCTTATAKLCFSFNKRLLHMGSANQISKFLHDWLRPYIVSFKHLLLELFRLQFKPLCFLHLHGQGALTTKQVQCAHHTLSFNSLTKPNNNKSMTFYQLATFITTPLKHNNNHITTKTFTHNLMVMDFVRNR